MTSLITELLVARPDGQRPAVAVAVVLLVEDGAGVGTGEDGVGASAPTTKDLGHGGAGDGKNQDELEHFDLGVCPELLHVLSDIFALLRRKFIKKFRISF